MKIIPKVISNTVGKALPHEVSLPLVGTITKIFLSFLLLLTATATQLMAIMPSTKTFTINICGETWDERVDSGTNRYMIQRESPQGKANVLYNSWTSGCASSDGCVWIGVKVKNADFDELHADYLAYVRDPVGYCANPYNIMDGICKCFNDAHKSGEPEYINCKDLPNPYDDKKYATDDTVALVGYSCNSCPQRTLLGDSLPAGVSPHPLFDEGSYCEENICTHITDKCPKGYAKRDLNTGLARKYKCEDSGWQIERDNCYALPVGPGTCQATVIDGISFDSAAIGTEQKASCLSPKKGEKVFTCTMQIQDNTAQWTQTAFCKDCLAGDHKYKDCGDENCGYETYTCTDQATWKIGGARCVQTGVLPGGGIEAGGYDKKE